MTEGWASEDQRLGCGLVAVLGWDWGDFQEMLPRETAGALVEAMKVLDSPPEPDEPEHIEVKARLGRQMIRAEFQRRLLGLLALRAQGGGP